MSSSLSNVDATTSSSNSRSGSVSPSRDDLEEENVVLREEISSLKRTIVQLMTQADGIDQSSPSDESSNVKLRQEIESLEKFNQEQSAIGAKLQHTLTALKKESSEHKLDLLRLLPLQQEKEKLRKQRDENGAAIIQLKHINFQGDCERRKLEVQLQAAAQAEIEMREEMESLKQQLTKSELEVILLSTTNTSLKQQLTESADRLAKVNKKLTISEQRLGDVERRNSSQAKEIARQTSEVQKMRQELLAHRAKLQEKDDREDELVETDIYETASVSSTTSSNRSRLKSMRMHGSSTASTPVWDAAKGMQENCVGLDVELPSCAPFAVFTR